MKIYQTVQEAKNSKLTIFPGIYYFKNKVNNKYYIGQALNIRKRFYSHYIQIKKENNKYPIYKAIVKYGLENFEYGVIGIFRTWESQELLKKKLDFLEKKYIKEYNSYGNTGYNQTLGGDGGILGYKMTEEQKEHISQNVKQWSLDGRNDIYVYDLLKDTCYLFHSFQEASEYFSVNRNALYSATRRENGIALKQFVINKDKEKLNDIVKTVKSKKSFTSNSGQFKVKYSLEEYKQFKELYPNLSLPKLAKVMGVCKKTVYNYEHLL